MQSGQSQDTTIALLKRDIAALQKHQVEQDRLIANIRSERDKALLWGIGALGAMVLSMGAWIVSFAKDHLK